MSKKHSARKRKRRKRKPPACKPGSPPAALLGTLAAVLTALDDAGCRVRTSRDCVIADPAGYVLPPVREGEPWVARPVQPLPVPVTADDPDGDQD